MTSFARVCRYIHNLDKDAEFQAMIRAAAEAEESRERRRVRATLDALISFAEDFAAISPEDMLLSINQDGGNPYAIARGNLKDAEEKLDESLLGPDADAYRRRIQELKPRVDAVGLSFAVMMSNRSNQITKILLRKTPLEELKALELAYDTADYVAIRLRTNVDPDSDQARRLAQASGKCSRVLHDIEEEIRRKEKELARREEIRKLMRLLCMELPKRERDLQEEIRYKREVDRESGTRDLALDRELAMEKIELREMRKEAVAKLKRLGAPYNKSKCSKYR